METVLELKRTPLFGVHKALGARIVPFAGWEMPVQYAGVITEHLAVRSSCGLFDVSHMGEILVTGKGALGALSYLATNDLEKTVDGQCQYTLLCHPDGGVVDDCIIYRLGSEKFLVCVNASNTAKAFEWMTAEAGGRADITDVSDEYAEIAVQGPASTDVLRPLVSIDAGLLKRYHFACAKVCGVDAIISRTGYTGEDGFEIYAGPGHAVKLWDALMEAGKKHAIVPAGLGARDTLRLEMGYPLYGHELSEKITPLEAGLKRFVALNKKADFIGKTALKKQADGGLKKAIAGFELIDAGVPRQGYEVSSGGKVIGVVASGTHSPSLGKGIGTAYADAPGGAVLAIGTEISVMVRNRALKARVVKTPFYVHGARQSK